MRQALGVFVLAAAGAAGLLWLGWSLLGAIGLVAAAPLVAGLLTLPLQALLGTGAREAAWLVREQALRGTRHYRGRQIGVVIDETGHWWLAVPDLRSVLPGLPDTARLLAAARGRCSRGTWRLPAHLRDDALFELLGPAQARSTQQLLQWLRHQQADEARRARR